LKRELERELVARLPGTPAGSHGIQPTASTPSADRPDRAGTGTLGTHQLARAGKSSRSESISIRSCSAAIAVAVEDPAKPGVEIGRARGRIRVDEEWRAASRALSAASQLLGRRPAAARGRSIKGVRGSFQGTYRGGWWVASIVTLGAKAERKGPAENPPAPS